MTTLIRHTDAHLFLRRVLLLDAVASAATGLLLAAAAEHLAGLLGLPITLMRYAGLSLIPFAAVVAFVGTRPVPPRAAVVAIIIANALWTLDSLALLASGLVSPTLLGSAFVIAQAVTVGALAALQWNGLKRTECG